MSSRWRRIERRGLDADGLDVYAEEVFEERRERARARVRFDGFERVTCAALASFDAITAHGEPESRRIVREIVLGASA